MVLVGGMRKTAENRNRYYLKILASTPCAECSQSFPPDYMTFQYDDPRDDERDRYPAYLAVREYSLEQIDKELARGKIYCIWHSLEISYLREVHKVGQKHERSHKTWTARFHEQLEKEVRTEVGAPPSFLEQLQESIDAR